jgi:hypothetical protein
MKPKPLASLNHFTLPVVRMFGTSSFNCVGVPFLRYLSDYCLFAAEMAAFVRQKIKKDLANFPGPSTVRWLRRAIVALQGLNLTPPGPAVNEK